MRSLCLLLHIFDIQRCWLAAGPRRPLLPLRRWWYCLLGERSEWFHRFEWPEMGVPMAEMQPLSLMPGGLSCCRSGMRSIYCSSELPKLERGSRVLLLLSPASSACWVSTLRYELTSIYGPEGQKSKKTDRCKQKNIPEGPYSRHYCIGGASPAGMARLSRS